MEKKKLGFEPDWLLKIDSLIDSVIFMEFLFEGTVDSTRLNGSECCINTEKE